MGSLVSQNPNHDSPHFVLFLYIYPDSEVPIKKTILRWEIGCTIQRKVSQPLRITLPPYSYERKGLDWAFRRWHFLSECPWRHLEADYRPRLASLPTGGRPPPVGARAGKFTAQRFDRSEPGNAQSLSDNRAHRTLRRQCDADRGKRHRQGSPGGRVGDQHERALGH